MLINQDGFCLKQGQLVEERTSFEGYSSIPPLAFTVSSFIDRNCNKIKGDLSIIQVDGSQPNSETAFIRNPLLMQRKVYAEVERQRTTST